MVLGLLCIDVVKPFALNLAINEGTTEGSEKFFGLGMRSGLSVFLAMPFVGFRSLIGSRTSEQLMGELGLVRGFGNLVIGIRLIGVTVEPTHCEYSLE